MVQDTRTEACSLIDKTNHATAHEQVAECCRRCWARLHLPDDASTALGRLERFDALTPGTCLGAGSVGFMSCLRFRVVCGLVCFHVCLHACQSLCSCVYVRGVYVSGCVRVVHRLVSVCMSVSISMSVSVCQCVFVFVLVFARASLCLFFRVCLCPCPRVLLV